jgi:hypothetical protein
MGWAKHVARFGDMRSAYKISVEWREEKSPLGRHSLRWEDNIRLDLREIRWEVVDWFHLAQDRDHWRSLMNTVMNLWISLKAGNFLSS